ncbi:MAG: immunity 49 family protein [Ramlibacter sp.]|nr:immunity 49 family protein [Ramlibacter sp.]
MSAAIDAKYQADVDAGIRHIAACIESEVTRGFVDNCVKNVRTGAGNPYISAQLLVTHLIGRGLLAWFRDRDLHLFKQHFYGAAKLQCFVAQRNPSSVVEQDYLCLLLADSGELLEWFKKYAQTKELDRDNPKSHSFRHGQMMYALAGDWEKLESRAQLVLATQPASQKNFIPDERFYLSLARGDVSGMAGALGELTNPKLAKIRNNQFEFGYTHFFIGTHAVMYAKLAWLNGYEITIDTPYIPPEWLPFSPLQAYETPFDLIFQVEGLS